MTYLIALHTMDGSVNVWDSRYDLYDTKDKVEAFLTDYYGDLSYIHYVISDQPLAITTGRSFDAYYNNFEKSIVDNEKSNSIQANLSADEKGYITEMMELVALGEMLGPLGVLFSEEDDDDDDDDDQ